MPVPSHRPSGLIRHGITISLLEVSVIGAMFAAVENWLVPLLQVRLGTTAANIGYVTLIPQLGVISVGLVARPLIRWLGGNKRTVLMTNLVQVAMLFGLVVPLLWPVPHRIAMGMTMAILFGIAGALGSPAWTSWMGDLIPKSVMGRVQARRLRLFLPVKLICGFAFSQCLLRIWPTAVSPYGIAIIFAIAGVSRIVSTILIYLQPEPQGRPVWRGPESNNQPVANVSLMDFLRGLGKTHIGIWTGVWAAFLVGVFISAPFTQSYFISDAAHSGLGLDDRRFWWLVNVSAMTRVLVLPLVGRGVDLFGASAMLRLGVIGIGVSVVAYVFTQNYWILFGSECFGGMAWCLAEVAVLVLLFSCNRDPHQRVRLIGFYQVVTGSAIVVGTYLGIHALSYLRDHADLIHHHNPFRVLYALSVTLRIPGLVLALTLMPRLRILNAEETAGLWRLVPGTNLGSMGRSLIGVFRRVVG